MGSVRFRLYKSPTHSRLVSPSWATGLRRSLAGTLRTFLSSFSVTCVPRAVRLLVKTKAYGSLTVWCDHVARRSAR